MTDLALALAPMAAAVLALVLVGWVAGRQRQRRP
jgi:hypothetical protein